MFIIFMFNVCEIVFLFFFVTLLLPNNLQIDIKIQILKWLQIEMFREKIPA